MKYLNILLVLVLLGSGSVSAATSKTIKLSLKQAIEMALKHSDDLKISQENVEKMEYTIIETRALALPQISGDVTWTKYMKVPTMPSPIIGTTGAQAGLVLGTEDVPVKQDYGISYGVTLTQPIWTFGKVGGALEIAKEALDIEKMSQKSTQFEVEYNAKTIYYSVLFSQKMLTISQASYQNALNNKQKLLAKFKHGRLSRYDNIKMSADIASRVPTVEEAKSNLNLAKKRMKMYLGIDDDISMVLTDKFRQVFGSKDENALKREMVAVSPSLEMLRKSVKVNDLVKGINKADFLPSIAGFAKYEYSGDSNKTLPESQDMSTTAVAGVTMTWKLWDSGATYGKYRQAVNDKKIAEIKYQKTLKGLKLLLESKVSEFKSLVETYEANKVAESLARKSYKISKQSFLSGRLSQSRLNDAELMLTGAKMKAESTIFKLNVTAAEIDKLVAKSSKGE
jgi:outer membrane protein TolC